MRTAVVLVAHGSDHTPAVRSLLDTQRQELERWGVAHQILVGFLRALPRLESVLDSVDADRVVIVPLLTSDGHYARSVLPKVVRTHRRADRLDVRIEAPIGLHPDLPGLVARRIRAIPPGGPGRPALLVVGHGTTRHPDSGRATRRFARRLGNRLGRPARVGFLDQEPTATAVWQTLGPEPVIVVPFFIGGGGHAVGDLCHRFGLDPAGAGRWVAHPERPVLIDQPVGMLPELTSVLADVASRGLRRSGRGCVVLVGAGPGHPGLLTVQGRRWLTRADVIVHDRLIDRRLLALARIDTEIVDVGKTPGHHSHTQEQINAILVDRARAGKLVVRLKGGDPFVFGRGSEERDACRDAGVGCIVVSGVTSAIAAPAAAGIPVTRRGTAQSFAVVTAEGATSSTLTPALLEALVAIDTVVVLMGRATLAVTTAGLIAAGRSPSTPVACVQSGTTREQRVTRGTLETIAALVDRDDLRSPMVTVIGAVAAHGGSDPDIAALVREAVAPC